MHKKNKEKYSKVPPDIHGRLTGMRRVGSRAAGKTGKGGRARADGPGRTGQGRRARSDGPGRTGQGEQADDSKVLFKYTSALHALLSRAKFRGRVGGHPCGRAVGRACSCQTTWLNKIRQVMFHHCVVAQHPTSYFLLLTT